MHKLVYVFPPGGSLLNAEIIRQGYGFACTGFPFERMEEFRNWSTKPQERVGAAFVPPSRQAGEENRVRCSSAILINSGVTGLRKKPLVGE